MNSSTPSAHSSFLEEVVAATPGACRLDMCIQCGTCGGSCPSGADMDHTPRAIFAMIRANMQDEVLQSNTPWFCVSCYLCTVRCPQEVKITDIMYTLKSMAVNKNLGDKAGKDLSSTFANYVENYGRAFEFGLATRYSMKHPPASLAGLAMLGLGLFTKGRMDLTPGKIDGLTQLQAILGRAKEMEEK